MSFDRGPFSGGGGGGGAGGTGAAVTVFRATDATATTTTNPAVAAAYTFDTQDSESVLPTGVTWDNQTLTIVGDNAAGSYLFTGHIRHSTPQGDVGNAQFHDGTSFIGQAQFAQEENRAVQANADDYCHAIVNVAAGETATISLRCNDSTGDYTPSLSWFQCIAVGGPAGAEGPAGASFGGKDEGPIGNNNRLILDDDENSYFLFGDNTIFLYLGGALRWQGSASELQSRLIHTFHVSARPDADGGATLGDSARGWTSCYMAELGSEPGTPTTGAVRYIYDNAGTSEYRIKFANGTVKTIATDV